MHTVLAGTLAGLLHVVSGPDHLVAVAPLALKRPLVGLRVGLTWGVGHASGVILVGMAGVVLRVFTDIELLSRWAEFIVGFVLIGVGVWAILQMRKVVLHRHPHSHTGPPAELVAAASNPADNDRKGHCEAPRSGSSPDKEPLPHAHLHVHASMERHSTQAHQRHHARGSFVVGLVHGAAGTGHLLGVLPSLALPPVAGALYLASYGVAAVVAMGAFGMLMGVIGCRLQPNVLRSVMLGSGILAIVVGMIWLVSAWQQLG